MFNKSDHNGRPLKGLSLKNLKKKVNKLEEERTYDRSFSTWKYLKDLKKLKLKLKDQLKDGK
jgi:hypothetical protein